MVSYKGARVAIHFIRQDELQDKRHRCHRGYGRLHGEQTFLLQRAGIHEGWWRRSDVLLLRHRSSKRRPDNMRVRRGFRPQDAF